MVLALATGVFLNNGTAQAATQLSSGWLAQHTLAGSKCWIFTNGAQAPYSPNSNASSWSKKSVNENCLVWTAYGIGSNGTGTVISVGDQNMRQRWTNFGNSPQQNSQAFGGSLNTYNDIAANGTTWVAVGNIGRVQRSTNDGVNFSSPASKPGGVPALQFVEQDHGTWIAGGGSQRLLWRSVDGGNTWSDVSVPVRPDKDALNQVTLTSATYNAASGKWFAAGTGGQIWTSSNDGVNWTVSHDVEAGDLINDIDSGPSGTIIGVTGGWGRAVKSTNGGATWTRIGIDQPSVPSFRAVKAGPNGEWIAAGLANRVYYSLNDGVTWQAAGGLPSLRTWEDVTYAGMSG